MKALVTVKRVLHFNVKARDLRDRRLRPIADAKVIALELVEALSRH